MRPSGIFREYKEKDCGWYIRFEGELHPRFKNIPQSQLAFFINGNKDYRKFAIERKDLDIKGIITTNEKQKEGLKDYEDGLKGRI